MNDFLIFTFVWHLHQKYHILLYSLLICAIGPEIVLHSAINEMKYAQMF